MPDSTPHLTTTPAWAKGMRKIAAGIYVDRSGNIHLSQAEICQYFGVPPTKANCDTIVRAWNDSIEKETGKRVEVREVED